VSGSDIKSGVFLRELEASGIAVAVGHDASHVAGAELVIVSSAVPESNPEVRAAQRLGIPVLGRREYLGRLTAGLRTIAVAGTHGKTTTSALITWLMGQLGLAPGFILGGWVESLGANGGAGGGEFFVIEADEYDRAFHALYPELAVITNVEHDHPDCYPKPADFRRAFERFASQVKHRLILCLDDPGAATLEGGDRPPLTYGLAPDADWRAAQVATTDEGGMRFSLARGGAAEGPFEIALPGVHNVCNALAALAVMAELGVDLGRVREILPHFQPVARRFQVLGEVDGVIVVDDYAHHPTEIMATLSAARGRYPEARIWAVFQPHTFSRTREFMQELGTAFEAADEVIVLDVFAAREAPVAGVDGQAVAQEIDHQRVEYLGAIEAATAYLVQHVESPAVVITLSAGDGNQVGMQYINKLQREGGG
jgi:UDP-N-acetylmuramate--alanine ligase